jgi:uncharacterized protein (TIGR03435 family)
MLVVMGDSIARGVEAAEIWRKTGMLNDRVIMRNSFWGILLLSAGLGFGQAPAAKQAPKVEFEVASIKPAQPLATQAATGKFHVGMTIDGARVDIGSLSLADLIPIAFKVKPYQVSGPGWMSSERFDVIGKIPDGAGKEQVPEMLQALLADRFKLTIHRDNKDQAVYAMVVGKNGSKLKEAVPEPETPASADDSKKGIVIGSADGSQTRVIQDGKGLVVRGGQTGNMRMRAGPDGSMRMEASNMTMVALADALTRFVDRPVIDLTELKGGYQVTLDLSMADMIKAARVAGFAGGALGGGPAGGPGGAAPASPADAASDPSSNTIFAAVQQLGLKLEPRKTPIEEIVVDHLEKTPTEN